MELLWIGLYVVLATMTGGYYHAAKTNKNSEAFSYSYDPIPDLPLIALFFPITWLWCLVLKPMGKLAMLPAQWHINWMHQRTLARELKVEEQRVRIAEADQEIETLLNEDRQMETDVRREMSVK